MSTKLHHRSGVSRRQFLYCSGTDLAARSAPDGYTLALGSTGTHTVNQSLYENIGYDPVKDFAPVSMLCYYNNVLVVNPSFPARTLPEFIALIKANPGKYFYGITQNGSSAHLAMELLKATAGLELHGGTPQELGGFVASESRKWAALFKQADIKAS